MKEILNEVMERIVPSAEEENRLNKVVKELEGKIKKYVPKDAEIMLVGSVAKGTWLKNSLDIDFFILFPLRWNKREMEKVVLDTGKKVLDKIWIQYAEHPYVRGYYKNYRVDIVPSYKIKSITEMKSSVDRTPFHTEFIRKNMDDKLKNDARLLKQFIKGIGCYGAEAKVEGFSGYLVELLIIKYGGFLNVLKAAIKWGKKVYLTINGDGKKFSDRFVFIDPVDLSRNVAAALSEEKLELFISAARDFLNEPSIKFFFPPPPPKIDDDILEKKLGNFIGICFKKPDIVDDVLYPQLKKAASNISSLFFSHDFKVVRKAFHADGSAFIAVELESKNIEDKKLHMGPPLKSKKHVESFIKRWENDEHAIGKPFEKDGRMWIWVRREYTDARKLLKDKIKDVRLGKHIDKIKSEIKICEKGLKRYKKYWYEFFCPLPPWKR